MPRALPEALLEGLAWDAMGRRYETLSDVYGYSARVASAVGAMMAVLMGVRDRDALARACDLGVAMQLTNIARDIGEDALEGRLYLPTDWLDEAGIDPDAFLADPQPHQGGPADDAPAGYAGQPTLFPIGAGDRVLPLRCRPGIFAARLIYAGIGARVAEAGYDSITARARTSKPQKTAWLVESGLRSGLTLVSPRAATLYADPIPETAFLVSAAARERDDFSRADGLIDALSALAAGDRERRQALIQSRFRPT